MQKYCSTQFACKYVHCTYLSTYSLKNIWMKIQISLLKLNFRGKKMNIWWSKAGKIRVVHFKNCWEWGTFDNCCYALYPHWKYELWQIRGITTSGRVIGLLYSIKGYFVKSQWVIPQWPKRSYKYTDYGRPIKVSPKHNQNAKISSLTRLEFRVIFLAGLSAYILWPCVRSSHKHVHVSVLVWLDTSLSSFQVGGTKLERYLPKNKKYAKEIIEFWELV